MPTRKNTLIIFFISCYIIGIGTVFAEPIDSGTYWFMVDTTPDTDARALFKTLDKLLKEKGKVSQEHIHSLAGDRAAKDEIQIALADIGHARGKIDTCIFLYHGAVSKQLGGNAMHLSTQSEETIQDSVLNQWLKGTGADRRLVIIDGYANDDSLTIYYANRETLGTAALNVIQPPDAVGKNAFLQALIDALSEEKIDIDKNRHISIIEIYQHLQTNSAFEQAIFAPTGDVEETVMKLSPAINVTTFPEGAQILLNEKESGLTPQLFTDDLQQGNYTVSVRKAGYNSPEAKTDELKLKQGEVINFAWALKPISVFGTVSGPSDVSVVGTQVSIDGTGYEAPVGEDGTYSFQDWQASKMLTPGTDYTLYAKQGDLYHGSATFTFAGYAAIEQPIELVKKTWFEISELEFSRNDHQKAVNAFQNGIELTTDFPPMSEDLTVLLFTTFADAIDRSQVQDVNYYVATAKLAEAYQQPELIKKYWKLVKLKAEKGSSAAKLAGQRLWRLNPWRNILNIGIACLLVIVIASGIWTFYRYQKSKQTETEVDA
ncbi:MAG: PEGA domain-containing protein [Candidatus Poribacteria bacterium]|nr:PEGA domain-containing protein [Candidatus Poribacteria bacterium]